MKIIFLGKTISENILKAQKVLKLINNKCAQTQYIKIKRVIAPLKSKACRVNKGEVKGLFTNSFCSLLLPLFLPLPIDLYEGHMRSGTTQN
jgi:hypothetical protein